MDIKAIIYLKSHYVASNDEIVIKMIVFNTIFINYGTAVSCMLLLNFITIVNFN